MAGAVPGAAANSIAKGRPSRRRQISAARARASLEGRSTNGAIDEELEAFLFAQRPDGGLLLATQSQDVAGW